MVSENCLSISCSKRGKTVVVVGACSSIGDALIPELLDKYSSMVLTESPQNFESLVGKYGEKPNVKLLEMDVLNKSQIKTLDIYIEEKKLVVDSFVYLAGINVLVSALETTEEIWDRIIDVNLKGFFFVSKVIAKNMILNGGGSILGIASQHAVVANVDRAAYCASSNRYLRIERIYRMKNKNELLDKQNKNVTFEEMEKVEEFGAAQDYITGASIGIGIVAAIVALT